MTSSDSPKGVASPAPASSVSAPILPTEIKCVPPHLGTFLYTYDDGASTYKVVCSDDTHLHWKGLTGSDAGNEGYETNHRSVVSHEVHFIGWKEKDGSVITQALNYKTGTVNSVMVAGDEHIVFNGTIERLSDEQ